MTKCYLWLSKIIFFYLSPLYEQIPGIVCVLRIFFYLSKKKKKKVVWKSCMKTSCMKKLYEKVVWKQGFIT